MTKTFQCKEVKFTFKTCTLLWLTKVVYPILIASVVFVLSFVVQFYTRYSFKTFRQIKPMPMRFECDILQNKQQRIKKKTTQKVKQIMIIIKNNEKLSMMKVRENTSLF